MVLDEPRQIETATSELEQQAEHLHAELVLRNEWRDSEAPPYRPWAEVLERIDVTRCLTLSHDPDSETVEFIHPGSFAGRHRALVTETRALRDRGHQIVIVSQQSARLAEVLNEAGVVTVQANEVSELAAAADAPVPLVHGSLQDGWRSDELRLTIFTDRELFGWAKEHRQTRKASRTSREAFLSDLEPGTMVVHIDHGIGRYRGPPRRSPTRVGSRWREARPKELPRFSHRMGGKSAALARLEDDERDFAPLAAGLVVAVAVVLLDRCAGQRRSRSCGVGDPGVDRASSASDLDDGVRVGHRSRYQAGRSGKSPASMTTNPCRRRPGSRAEGRLRLVPLFAPTWSSSSIVPREARGPECEPSDAPPGRPIGERVEAHEATGERPDPVRHVEVADLGPAFGRTGVAQVYIPPN